MTLTDDRILGYLLRADEATTLRETEKFLLANPESMQTYDRLKAALSILHEDTDPEVPPELFVRTISGVACWIAEREPRPTLSVSRIEEVLSSGSSLREFSTVYPSQAQFPNYMRRNILAGLLLASMAFAVILPLVVWMRGSSANAACQRNIQLYYQALSGYSDLNDGAYPRIEEGESASKFVAILHNAGQLPDQLHGTCPSVRSSRRTLSADGDAVDYAYTLGWRDATGNLNATRRNEEMPMPLLSDAPVGSTIRDDAIKSSHGRGFNVLFGDGTVRFVKTPRIGPSDDNIFCNEDGEVKAGKHRFDAVLAGTDGKP